MARKQDYYEQKLLAELYDWQYEGIDQDLPLLTELAKRHGSPVLEVACGTGRVTIPLARAGLEVVGVDLSIHMLDIARRKLEYESAEVRGRVELQQADMRELDLGRTFSCVLVPQAAVFHLDGPEALRQSLRRFLEHLQPGGTLVIDVGAPHRLKNQEVGREILVGERIDPEGVRTREFNEKLYIDRERQVVCCRHRFVFGEGEGERQIEFDQEYRWLEEAEGLSLLRDAGYRQTITLGNYDKSPFTADSPRLLFLAQK